MENEEMGVIFFIFKSPGKVFYELNSFQKNPGREERKKVKHEIQIIETEK